MATCNDCLCELACKGTTLQEMYVDKAETCPFIKNKAEYVKVKYGHWIDTNHECGNISCSECGAIERPSDSNYRTPKCPLCGAIMDEGKETNDEV